MLSTAKFEVPNYLMEASAGLAPCTMAVAGADNVVAMESAKQASDAGLITPVLVGNNADIKAIANTLSWDVSAVRIIEAIGEKSCAETAVSLARNGEVASLMKGHIHTDALMRAVVQRDTGLRTDRRLSHVFHMTVPGSDKVLYITDAAINVLPDANTKIDIINNAVEMAHALGHQNPHVALLSATESILESMPSSTSAAEVAKRAQAGEVKGAVVDGPFAFDNAVSMEAALMKGVDSPVAGNADILVAPNIEMGNGLFKMMVYFMSGLAAGLVMGARVPIVLTSRADPPQARLAASAIAALIASDRP